MQAGFFNHHRKKELANKMPHLRKEKFNSREQRPETESALLCSRRDEEETQLPLAENRSRQLGNGVRRGVPAQRRVPPHVHLGRLAPRLRHRRRRRHDHPLLGAPLPPPPALRRRRRLRAAAAAGGGADPRVRPGPDVAVGGAGGAPVAALRPAGPDAALLRRVRHARARALRRVPGRRPRRAPRPPPRPRRRRRPHRARRRHQLRRARRVPPRPRAAGARRRPAREGGAVRLRRVQGRGRRPRARGQDRRRRGHGPAGARRHPRAAPAHGRLRSPPHQVPPRVPPPRHAPEVLRGQEGGQDSAHQRDQHRGRRLPAHSSASGGVHHLGRVRPDLPGRESAHDEGEAWGEGDGEGDPQHGAPAAAGGFQALQPHPPRLPAPAALHLQWQRRRRRHDDDEVAPVGLDGTRSADRVLGFPVASPAAQPCATVPVCMHPRSILPFFF
ncbi:hypothetical protein BS78_03G051300 [Paspalum vaginatum]|nr:hypothetical protein BS78_03G051300 [Paspalum vaginatum]